MGCVFASSWSPGCERNKNKKEDEGASHRQASATFRAFHFLVTATAPISAERATPRVNPRWRLARTESRVTH